MLDEAAHALSFEGGRLLLGAQVQEHVQQARQGQQGDRLLDWLDEEPQGEEGVWVVLVEAREVKGVGQACYRRDQVQKGQGHSSTDDKVRVLHVMAEIVKQMMRLL